VVFLFFCVFFSCEKEQHHLPFSKNSQTVEPILGVDAIVAKADSFKLQLKFTEAFLCYLKALKQSIKSKNIDNQFYIHVKIAEYYRYRALLENAKNELFKVEKLITNGTISKSNLFYYYNRKAAVYNEIGKYPDSVLHLSLLALNLAQKLKDTNGISNTVNEIGSYYERQKLNYGKALEYYYQALEMTNKKSQFLSYLSILSNICRVQIKNKQYGEAKKNTLLGFSMIDIENRQQYNLVYVYAEMLSIIYAKEKNFERAYHYSSVAIQFYGQFFQNAYDDELMETSVHYQTALKDQQLKLSQEQLSSKEKQIQYEGFKFKILIVIILFSFILVLIAIWIGIKGRKKNKRLLLLNEQNKILISETNHRVNNNLQLISIFINNELKEASDETKDKLKKLSFRVYAIAALHRLLYTDKQFNKIQLDEYIRTIINNLQDAFDDYTFHINAEIPHCKLTMNRNIVFLGLLMSELIMNSMKHGYSHKNEANVKSLITIAVKIEESNLLLLEYKDNGIGFKGEINPKIVTQICRQLNSSYYISGENGFFFTTKITLK
jgi:two-component sensor histidine kinase